MGTLTSFSMRAVGNISMCLAFVWQSLNSTIIPQIKMADNFHLIKLFCHVHSLRQLAGASPARRLGSGTGRMADRTMPPNLTKFNVLDFPQRKIHFYEY